MTPRDSSGLPDDYSVRQTLIDRFGAATADSLINTYEDNWITAQDLDNIKALGMNVIRVPFWYRNLQNEQDSRLRLETGHSRRRRTIFLVNFRNCTSGNPRQAG